MTTSTDRVIGATRVVDTAFGRLTLEATDRGLRAVLFGDREQGDTALSGSAATAVLDQAEEQLREYFEGRRTVFELSLPDAGTPFQRKVWEALVSIPFGATRTYGEVARTVGLPRAAQAVGLACGSNPLAIVVPCHRVIGANGRLTGYAGGLDHKRRLLDFEQQRESLFQLPESGWHESRGSS